jgi:hypothetical protein
MQRAQRSERAGERQGLQRPESSHRAELDSVTLQTPRGTIVIAPMPLNLQRALIEYDQWRVDRPDPEVADRAAEMYQTTRLQRLRRGLSRLTFRGVCRIATRHSHVCPVYVRQHLSTLTTLMGLFWWNDGGSTVRERLLLLAWRKGADA